jgi:small conductance mechanosensitive channel
LFSDFFTIERLIELVRILVGLFGIYLAVRLAVYFTSRALARLFLTGKNRDERRRQTVYTLMQSSLRYLFYFFAIVAVLNLFHVNTSSLITAAGVGGLIIGLGTQNLIRDLVAGFFILLEDQFAVGDLVAIGAAEGIVERMGIRTTAVRDPTGKLFVIPNGQINSLVVHSPNPWVILDYDLHGESPERLLAKLAPLLPRWREEIGNIQTPIQVWPLAAAEKNFLRFAALTEPACRYSVERELAGRLSALFESGKAGADS